MLLFLFALSRNIEPSPLWVGLPTAAIVTIANFAPTSDAISDRKALYVLKKTKPTNARDSTNIASKAPLYETVHL